MERSESKYGRGGKLMFLKNKVISIDLGTYETKVIEGKVTNKGIVIDKYFSFLTTEGIYKNGYIIDSERLENLLEKELHKHKITANDTYLTIKSSAIFTRKITLPNVGEKEIDGILKYKMDEYLPIDIENYVVQYRDMGNFESDGLVKQNILLIAIPKEVIKSHFKLLKDLELRPTVLDFQSNSVTKLINYNSLINGKYEIGEETFALVDLGFQNTNVTISKNGKMQVSRIIEKGGDDIDKNILNFFEYTSEQVEDSKKSIKNINEIGAEYTDYNRLVNIIRTSVEDIIKELEIIFKYYESREIGNNIQMILLYGGLSNIKGVDELFYNYFNISTMVVEKLEKIFMDEELNKYLNCISSLIRIEEQ